MAPVPPISLFGPASRAIASRTSGGSMAGFGITPLGWSRLFDLPASETADRILPLAALIGDDAEMLRATIAADPSPAAIAGLFDEWLMARLRSPPSSQQTAERLLDYLQHAHDIGIDAACAAIGVSESKLRRAARQHFGFPAKLLLRRSRFLKSLMALLAAPAGRWSQAIDFGYYDYAHFAREAQDFIGMSPRAFLALDRPMTRLSMQNRQRDLGAPVQGLHAHRFADEGLHRVAR